jgi:hypothetical protein
MLNLQNENAGRNIRISIIPAVWMYDCMDG